MEKTLETVLEMHKKGELTREKFDAMEDEEKKELFKAIEDEKQYSNLMSHIKDMEEADTEDDEEKEKSNDEEEEKKKSDDDEENKSDEQEDGSNKSNDEEDETNKAMKKKADMEAELYTKALKSKIKGLDVGEVHTHGTKEGTDRDTANNNLRKAFTDGSMSAERGGINILQKAVNSTNFLSVDVADKIFEAPEGPVQDLLSQFYQKRISGGNTARFVEVGEPNAAVVAKGGTINYTDDATVTADAVTLEKVVSSFRIAREDVVDPNTDLQSVFGRKAGYAVRKTVESRAVATIKTNLQSTRKIKIEGAKDSGAANNLSKLAYDSVVGLGASLDNIGSENAKLAMSPSLLRFILSRTDTTGQKIFEGNFAMNDNPARIQGIETVMTTGLDTYNTLKASTTDNDPVVLLSDWGNTCGVAWDTDEMVAMTTYNQTNDSYDIMLAARAKAAPVVLAGIVALTLSTS